MASRLDLHNELVAMLGSNNVYYQPPESVKMNYTAIRYSKSKIHKRTANDGAYLLRNCYEVIVISRRPDDPVIDKLIRMPLCTYDRGYAADNLNHDVFTIYY